MALRNPPTALGRLAECVCRVFEVVPLESKNRHTTEDWWRAFMGFKASSHRFMARLRDSREVLCGLTEKTVQRTSELLNSIEGGPETSARTSTFGFAVHMWLLAVLQSWERLGGAKGQHALQTWRLLQVLTARTSELEELAVTRPPR
eukprot:TRINITY_DN6594_c0_g2_i1.p1 TRINITY_DN6594_c0_g2~~TRINITY_DN6594_c0_g2_i1.p1  ORF type:complete len:147 (-),score=16.10 TRINITY_DN6594_c0_g2_i1:396-836(-)